MPNVSLGTVFEDFIAAKIREGRYQNASEVVRAGLRLLQDKELELAERRIALKKAINAAFDDDADDIPIDTAFDQLKAQYLVDLRELDRDP